MIGDEAAVEWRTIIPCQILSHGTQRRRRGRRRPLFFPFSWMIAIGVFVLYCTKLVLQSGLSLGKVGFCYGRRGEILKKGPGSKTTSTKEANLARM